MRFPVAVGAGAHQRSHEARGAPERPAVSLRGDGRLDGWLHGVRRIDHARRLEANVRLPRAAGRGRRFGSHRGRAGRTQRLRLCRPGREVPGRRRLASGRLLGRRCDRPRDLGDGAVAARRLDGRPGRRPHRRFGGDSPADDRAHDHRLRDAGRVLEPARFRRRASVQPSVGHGAPHAIAASTRRTGSKSASARCRRSRCTKR